MSSLGFIENQFAIGANFKYAAVTLNELGYYSKALL